MAVSQERAGKTKTEKPSRVERVLHWLSALIPLTYIVVSIVFGLAFGFSSETTIRTTTLTGGLLGIFAVILIVFLMLRGPKFALPSRDRVSEIRKHIDTAGRLLRGLEDELNTRAKVLEQLQTDAERYERLASLNAEQAKAIEDMVGRQFKRQARSTRLQWWVSIVLAIIFGFIVNWLSAPLLDWLIG